MLRFVPMIYYSVSVCLLALPIVGSVSAGVAGLGVARTWHHPGWTVVAHTGAVLGLLAGLGFVVWLAFWGLLPW